MGTDCGGEDKKKMGKGMDWCEEEKKKDEGVGLGRERPEKLGRGGGEGLWRRTSDFAQVPLTLSLPKNMYR